MSARLTWVVQDATGIGQAGKTVTLHRQSTGALIGTFTDAGSGNYYYDHNITEKVIIKVDAVTVTGTDGMMFLADDVSILGDLVSTAAGKGASLIGIHDAGNKYSGTPSVEEALQEIATAAELASAASGFGAALVGSYDNGGYFSGATVEAILQEIGAITSLLTGLTASAAELNVLDGITANTAELNRLDGISADVTAEALSALCAATFLEAGTFDALVGDANFSGNPIIGNVAAPGKISQAIRLLATYSAGITFEQGFTRILLWSSGTIAASAEGSLAADPATTVLWEETASSWAIKRILDITQQVDWRYIVAEFEGACDVGYTGSFRLGFHTLLSDVSFTGAAYIPGVAILDLNPIAVVVPTERQLTMFIKGADAANAKVNSKVRIWAYK